MYAQGRNRFEVATRGQSKSDITKLSPLVTTVGRTWRSGAESGCILYTRKHRQFIRLLGLHTCLLGRLLLGVTDEESFFPTAKVRVRLFILFFLGQSSQVDALHADSTDVLAAALAQEQLVLELITSLLPAAILKGRDTHNQVLFGTTCTL